MPCCTRADRSRRSATSASTSATTRACGFSTPRSWRPSRPTRDSAWGPVEPGLTEPAVRAVRDVEPDQLVAAPADPEVLDLAGQRRLRRRQRHHAGDRLHLLAGLVIDVDGVRLGGRELLAARRACPETVDLTLVLHRDRNDIGPDHRRGA